MLEAAATSDRHAELILATGNDDRIVYDLGSFFTFSVGAEQRTVKYDAGLLGHFATDTRAAVRWSSAVRASRDGAAWSTPVPEREFACYVNACNAALFDAHGSFENSVWGVKRRLCTLGLLQAPWCLHESGRPGLHQAQLRAYGALSELSDAEWLAAELDCMKREIGV
jgi:hypothetical protein